MKLTVNAKSHIHSSRKIYADDEYDLGQELDNSIDDVADAVEDMQDAVDDVDQDEIDIETDNNIANHYIAECEHCHGIFISAMIESDQEVDHVSGVCPLCDKEGDQYFRWIVRNVDFDEKDDEDEEDSDEAYSVSDGVLRNN